MNIEVTVVGTPLFEDRPTVRWPKGWPVPRIGEIVHRTPDGPELYVRYVEYYMSGMDDYTDEPTIHVVLSPSK